MSTLEIVALIAVVVWLGLLTLVIVLTIRQVAIITARIDQTGAPKFIDDGPALHSSLPEEVITSLPQLNSGVTSLLLLSASCTPCRHLAEGLQKKIMPRHGATVALVPGREELADGIAELLPASIQVIRDPDAAEVAKALDFQRVPAAIVIERGKVIAKAPPGAVNSVDELMDFLRFLEDRTPPTESCIPSHHHVGPVGRSKRSFIRCRRPSHRLLSADYWGLPGAQFLWQVELGSRAFSPWQLSWWAPWT